MRTLAALLTTGAVAIGVSSLLGDTLRLPQIRRRWSTPRWLIEIQHQGIPISRLAASSVVAATGAFLAIWSVTGAVLLGIVPAAGVAVLPAVFYRRRSRQDERRRLQAWPDALRALKASIAAGDSLHVALEDLVSTAPPPLRPIFERYCELASVLRQVDALEAVRVELAHPTSDEIFYVLQAASRGGSRLTAAILEDLAEAVTADLHLDEAIETARTEPRLNAGAAALLPWLVVVAMATRDGPLRDYYTSPSSIGVLLIGAAGTGTGLVWFWWLSRVRSRPRVLLAHRGQRNGAAD